MTIESRQTSLLDISLFGVGRGIGVEMLTRPLRVVTTRQQNSDTPIYCSRIAKRIYRQEGPKAFYKGVFAEILKGSSKEVWCWPVMIKLPLFLQRFNLSETQQHVTTGLSIALIHSLTTFPLEAIQQQAAHTGTTPSIFKMQWNKTRGFPTYFAKRSVTWTTFFVAQKKLRSQSQEEGALSLAELVKTGIQVSLIVSAASAPFDVANTAKHTVGGLNYSQLVSLAGMRKLFRGMPLNWLSLFINNIASVALLEKFDKQ
ncbi:MAG TPA: MC/SLC25 family protein [Rhabdochlamydiaceae bacterium]|jgi:hypothetical protein